MSPIYLNSQPSSSHIPFIDLNGDNIQQQNIQVFGYLHGGDHLSTSTNNSSFSYNPQICLNSKDMFSLDYTRHDQVKVVKHDKGSDLGQQACSSWFSSTLGEDSGSNSYAYSINHEENQKNQSVNKFNNNNNNDHQKYSRKWKSSKVKMMTNSKNSRDNIIKQEVDYHDHLPKRQTNDGIRVCTDCHTTSTPLWRSGPQGPKSLCNACGIRQRKARRAAMAAAAATSEFNNNTTVTLMPRVQAPKPKVQVIKSEKKLDHDKNHTLPLKKRSKIIDANNRNNYSNKNYYNNHNNNSKKLCFEDLALSSNKDYIKDNSMRSFPQDEEEGAILLMALSCGFACYSY